MTSFKSHPTNYSGLPYMTYVTLRGEERTVVVDYVTNGIIHYYDVESLAFDKASAFLTAVEEYQATKVRDWPLSVFMSANGYSVGIGDCYHIEALEEVSLVVGPAPSNWYPTVKTSWKRLDLKTGELTRSKNRRSREEIVQAELSKEQRIAAAVEARQRKNDEEAARREAQRKMAEARLAKKFADAEALRERKEIKAAVRAQRNAEVQEILLQQREARKQAKRLKA